VTEGNIEFVQILVGWAVTLPAVVTIIVRDERHLRGQRLERAWPSQSRDAAIFGLWLMGVHPVCLLVHFARTRRTTMGVLQGLGWLLLVSVGALGAELGAAIAIDGLGL